MYKYILNIHCNNTCWSLASVHQEVCQQSRPLSPLDTKFNFNEAQTYLVAEWREAADDEQSNVTCVFHYTPYATIIFNDQIKPRCTITKISPPHLHTHTYITPVQYYLKLHDCFFFYSHIGLANQPPKPFFIFFGSARGKALGTSVRQTVSWCVVPTIRSQGKSFNY